MADLTKYSHSSLELPKTFELLRTLIVKLIDKTYAGEVLTVKNPVGSSATNEANASPLIKSHFVSPSNEIIPEEEEINDDDSSSAFFSKQAASGDSVNDVITNNNNRY